jgi:hypothetical protein
LSDLLGTADANRIADQKRRRIMVTKSKIAVIAAVLGLLSASPPLAQSFNRQDGTGNEMPSYYDSQGGLHAGMVSEQKQIVAHRKGLSAFASVGRVGFASDQPSSTGGGSVGYNEMLQNDQW